jgi:hypothetical protein
MVANLSCKDLLRRGGWGGREDVVENKFWKKKTPNCETFFPLYHNN